MEGRATASPTSAPVHERACRSDGRTSYCKLLQVPYYPWESWWNEWDSRYLAVPRPSRNLLITRNTGEEKILNLQQRKREIISATLDGEEQLAEALTLEELRELLQ